MNFRFLSADERMGKPAIVGSGVDGEVDGLDKTEADDITQEEEATPKTGDGCLHSEQGS
ncbi:hypothetical protein MUP77_01095 [Candidatus Bathyarchaeota archaeon]|nr:hypothetical protein [Candidatus Bathyarchaeota archaeon]